MKIVEIAGTLQPRKLEALSHLQKLAEINDKRMAKGLPQLALFVEPAAAKNYNTPISTARMCLADGKFAIHARFLSSEEMTTAKALADEKERIAQEATVAWGAQRVYATKQLEKYADNTSKATAVTSSAPKHAKVKA